MERKCVRFAAFPDTTNGLIGFYETYYKFKTGKAIKPHIKVIKNEEIGRTFVQINTQDKMNELAKQVGAKTREQFQQKESKYWVSAYAKHLSRKIGEFLEAAEEPGLGLIINVNDGKEIDEWIELWCPKGEFVYRGTAN